MNEDRLFHETEKQKGLSIKLENLCSLHGQNIPINIQKKDEKHKLTSSHGTYCIHKG